MSPEELFCCLEYKDFVEFAMSTAMTLEEEHKNTDLMINVKPHEHIDTKLERKAAKEKAAQRCAVKSILVERIFCCNLYLTFTNITVIVHDESFIIPISQELWIFCYNVDEILI